MDRLVPFGMRIHSPNAGISGLPISDWPPPGTMRRVYARLSAMSICEETAMPGSETANETLRADELVTWTPLLAKAPPEAACVMRLCLLKLIHRTGVCALATDATRNTQPTRTSSLFPCGLGALQKADRLLSRNSRRRLNTSHISIPVQSFRGFLPAQTRRQRALHYSLPFSRLAEHTTMLYYTISAPLSSRGFTACAMVKCLLSKDLLACPVPY
jgi:hypothetical protein